MSAINRFPSKLAAYEAGRRAGAEEERKRAADAAQNNAAADTPAPLTLDAIRTGRFTDAELIARKDEVDALLAGGEAA